MNVLNLKSAQPPTFNEATRKNVVAVTSRPLFDFARYSNDINNQFLFIAKTLF